MTITTIVAFVLVLAVLIFVHELGHFTFAKLFGVRVDAFALGFGPPIVSWKRGETTYAINWFPFGGYVKIWGENPDEASTGGPEAPHSFIHKSRWKQAMVLVAGILFNFLFAWLLYCICFSSGVTAATDGFQQYSAYFADPRIMVTYVGSGSPADKAGIQAGDVITQIGVPAPVTSSSGPTTAVSYEYAVADGTLTVDSIPVAIDSSNGSPIEFSYSRAGQEQTVELQPQTGIVPGKYAIGIGMDDVADLHLPFLASVSQGFLYTVSMIGQTAVGLYSFVASIFHGTADFSQVSGPVGIAGIVGNAAQLGLTFLMIITAIISINLGVVNLIPFPALDGGRILFVGIESVIRRRIPAKFANAVNALGFALLMVLMVAVTYKDIVKLVVK